MMRQMRENTKWIMLLVAVAFVALMVFEWGMDLSGRSGAQAAGGELGRVNGEVITIEEWQNTFRTISQQQSTADAPIATRQLEDATWEQLVSQKLLAQEMRARGIRVSDDEIRDAAKLAPPPELMTAPIFQTDGQFDIGKYQQFLASPTLDARFLQQLEAYYRDVIPRSKLYFQTTAGLTVSDAQLWRMYRDANEAATVQYVVFQPDALVPDAQANVTDAAIRAYYDEHRNEFLRPAQASVRYALLNRAPTAADSAEARHQAEQYRAAVAGGESFEAVARRASGADTLTRGAGEEFRVVRGQAAPALDQAVFATAVGQLTQPILTQMGYHIVQVEGRTADTARVRQIMVPVALSRQAEDRLLDRADSLEDAATTRGLEQAARSMGLTVRTSELTPALPVLPGVGAVDDGIDWAFEDAAIGETSEVFEGEQAFYILELLTRRDEGPLSLQEATPTIRALLMKRAKIDRARQLVADAERRARAGAPLEQIAAEFGTRVQDAGPFTRSDFVPGMGRMNAAIGAAFGLATGQTSPLIEAEDQLFLVRTVARAEANRAEWQAQLAAQRGRVLQQLAETRWQQYLSALRDNAKIVDNRRQVFRRTTDVTN